MRIALDTNILVANWNDRDPDHDRIKRFVHGLVDEFDALLVPPQCLYELWVVATRPTSVNGLGLAPEEAGAMLESTLRTCIVLPDPPDLVYRWMDLCRSVGIRGRRAHDARIAAWMRAQHVTQLATLNGDDFAGIPGVTCVAPR